MGGVIFEGTPKKHWCLTAWFLGTSLQCGVFSVATENIENYEDFVVTDLKLTHTGTGEER